MSGLPESGHDLAGLVWPETQLMQHDLDERRWGQGADLMAGARSVAGWGLDAVGGVEVDAVAAVRADNGKPFTQFDGGHERSPGLAGIPILERWR
jgi:hypothetical protein